MTRAEVTAATTNDQADLPDATVAIATLDPDHNDFAECLSTATASGRPVVVVDMSTTKVVRDLCANYGNVQLVEAYDSLGLADSRNRALAAARTDIVLFLDSDAFARPGWADELIAGFADDRVGIVAARVLSRWAVEPPTLFKSQLAGLWLSELDLGDHMLDIPYAVGTSFAVHRRRAVEEFDVRLGRHPGDRMNGEDSDFCVRTRELGYLVRYQPSAVVEHRVSATRASWVWMWKRAYDAGRDRTLTGEIDAVPLRVGRTETLFKLAVGAPYMLGRLRTRFE